MSKHAVKSFSDGLRREINNFNIKVITIEPTLYRTPITDWDSIKTGIDNVWDQTSNEVQSFYCEKWRQSYYKRSENSLLYSRKQIHEVVKAMIDGINLEEPQIYYKCGGFLDYISIFSLSYFTESIQDFFFKNLFRNSLRVLLYFTQLFSNSKST